MIDPSRYFDGTKVPCRKCDTVNELESLAALFSTDTERRCSHCGYRFVAHILREMSKTMEMAMASPEWAHQFLTADRAWITAEMKNLVPIEED